MTPYIKYILKGQYKLNKNKKIIEKVILKNKYKSKKNKKIIIKK